MADSIAEFVIYPSIGIARVGNSTQEYFLGPEQEGPHPIDIDDFRDRQGRLKRQAARFRIYAKDSGGGIIREVTASEAEITWRVHIANKKAAWYKFDQAFDIPASQGVVPGRPEVLSPRRNANVKGAAREGLIIDPGPRIAKGSYVNKEGDDGGCMFDSGTFLGERVYLGEIRTDKNGRLIVLGGLGHSISPIGAPLADFANNDGWCDDVADGPVDATVRFDGRDYTAKGSWVIVGPPNYAPGIQAIATGYDLVFEAATKIEPSLRPPRPSFSRHILPILVRFTRYQWANAGFAREFGWGTLQDFLAPETIAKLSDPSDESRPVRRAIFERFRDPTSDHVQSDQWPAIYGDDVTLDATSKDPMEWMSVLPLQYEWLRQWAAGEFEADWGSARETSKATTPGEEVQGLDRAVLDETIGGPFHPGAEFTWPLRKLSLWAEPFRIRRRESSEPDFGPLLTSSIALMPGGPLDGSGPGDLTRWMALPWQTDTSSCLSAYRPWAGEYLPTFWPARVPNDVLTAENYSVIVDPATGAAEKIEALSISRRAKWLRDIVYVAGTYPPQVIPLEKRFKAMMLFWADLGIVVQKPGPEQISGLPKELWVEADRRLPQMSDKQEDALLWNENPRRRR